jgi:ribosomal protein L14E/L6E/L27E
MKEIAIILIIFLSSTCWAEIYKWVDEKGTAHFTEDPSTIPEKYRDRVKTRYMEEDSMTMEEKIKAEKQHEEEVKERLEKGQKEYEKSIEEEKLIRKRKELENAKEEERLRVEKEEKARRLKESQKEPTPEYARQVCLTCGGKGILPCVHCQRTGYMSALKRTCPFCNGAGFIRCFECNGKGIIIRRMR